MQGLDTKVRTGVAALAESLPNLHVCHQVNDLALCGREFVGSARCKAEAIASDDVLHLVSLASPASA